MLVKSIVRRMPPGVVSWLGRLQFTLPVLGPVIRYFGKKSTQGVCTIRHGLGAGLRIDNTFGHPGYALGTTEPEEQQAIERLLKPGDVFWNVGANIGFLAILASRCIGAEGLVVAFEPIASVAAMIRRNAGLNQMRNIQVIEEVVSDTAGEVDFFVGSNSGTNSMFQTRQTQGERTRMASTTLDRVASSGVRPPNLLSIDVEGAELHVLRGALQTLQQFRPVILLENHWLQTDVAVFFDQHLRPLGYEWFELDFTPYRPKPAPCREHSIFRTVEHDGPSSGV